MDIDARLLVKALLCAMFGLFFALWAGGDISDGTVAAALLGATLFAAVVV